MSNNKFIYLMLNIIILNELLYLESNAPKFYIKSA